LLVSQLRLQIFFEKHTKDDVCSAWPASPRWAGEELEGWGSLRFSSALWWFSTPRSELQLSE